VNYSFKGIVHFEINFVIF